MSSSFADALALANFIRGVPQLVREPYTIPQARAIVQDRMAHRNELFLKVVSRAIFAIPSSPYAWLLRVAGVEFGDIETLVAQNGIEATLETLRAAGVYVTYAEFKGREPITRGNSSFTIEPEQFDNPLVGRSLRSTSGGSRGKPVSAPLSLEWITDFAPLWGVWFDARGWMNHEFVLWGTSHLGMSGRYLFCAKFGARNEKWFSAGLTARFQDRALSTLTHGLVRYLANLPRPEFVSFDHPERVCEWLQVAATQGRKICLNTSPSAGVRISSYAQQHNISLHHVAVLCGGEPLTPTRKMMIEASGASAVAT